MGQTKHLQVYFKRKVPGTPRVVLEKGNTKPEEEDNGDTGNRDMSINIDISINNKNNSNNNAHDDNNGSWQKDDEDRKRGTLANEIGGKCQKERRFLSSFSAFPAMLDLQSSE